MNSEILGSILIFLLTLLLAYPLGKYIAKIFKGERIFTNFMNPVERFFFRICGIDPNESMNWKQFLKAMLTINMLWLVYAFFLLIFQDKLPMNPDGNPGQTPDLAFNTSISFLVNCNLQHYSGESGLTYFTQLFVVTFLQFVSAATGIAALVALLNAFKEKTIQNLGNFWNYFVKSITRILLPLSIIVAVILAFNGTPTSFDGKDTITTLQGDTVQVSRGPAAGMIAIKQIGTNGGGWFGVNSAHPLENPNYITNAVETIAILLIPIALVFTLGFYLNKRKLAKVIFGVMTFLFVIFCAINIYYETKGNPAIDKLGIAQTAGSLEGKEVRFGAAATALWSVATTSTSNGSVNGMHDSLTPISGGIVILDMMINALYGGVGVGILNYFIFIIIAVFISGLMVGRTPEFMGHKIEAREVKIAALITLLSAFLIKGFTALAAYMVAHHPDIAWQVKPGAWLNNPSYHGFSEMLYEYTSANANNGSGFEGLGDNNIFWNVTTGIVLLLGRFLPIIAPIAIAGLLARKKFIPESPGTLRTDSGTFGVMTLTVIIIVTALSYLPALALGPIAEFSPYNNSNKMTKNKRSIKLFEPALVGTAIRQSFAKLNPRLMVKNPVMFTVEIGTAVMLAVVLYQIFTGDNSEGELWYNISIFVILLLTVLFANFAEALAEARGKAQAESLRKTREDTPAKKVNLSNGEYLVVSSSQLKKNDLFICEAGDIIPMDGEIVEGIATIDESAITGESAPVIREAGGDKSSVTGGTKVLSDKIKVKVTTEPGESFLDKMIALVEGASRQKTPNEIALTILLAAFTLIFIIVCVTLKPFADYANTPITIAAFISLFVCLIPTTIGGLLSAIGIAGMDRALRANVIAKSGKAVETAGDIDVLLLDKTGTITIGNRKATNFYPANGIDNAAFIAACTFSSLADMTPEGKSIVELANLNEKNFNITGAAFIEFTAETRSSGVDLPGGTRIRKGAFDSIKNIVVKAGNSFPEETSERVKIISSNGGTPLVVCQNEKVLGVIELQDIIKPGIHERFERLRKMGVKTVMVTGDNPLTAKYIAEKAGVDDFIAEAKPEDKMNYIRKEQQSGKLVAMMGDGTNDAPALAQADVGVAMNSGTAAAKEAGNMVDLDNDPTKLIEVVEIGKQLLITRGTLTTFSIANDVAKYFAIVPALFIASIPALQSLNIMGLSSPRSAILAAVIFNAIIIPLLIPLALRGVAYKPIGASALLRRNLLIYGLGGLIVPFIGIKLIDMLLEMFM